MLSGIFLWSMLCNNKTTHWQSCWGQSATSS